MCIKKIGLELYLWPYFNYLTRKPIRMVQITYLWLNEDISAQNYPLRQFFLWNGQKNLWCKSCLFFGAFSLILLISIWCKPSFEIKFDQFGQVTMLFWCGGGSYPSPRLTRVPDINLIRVKWKKFNCQNLTNFLTKLFYENWFFWTFIFLPFCKYFELQYLLF